MSQSGGFVYHLRAFRYAKNTKQALWSSHREGVQKFLQAWNPPEKNLLLIGPSGGYSIPKSFLEKFETITAIEPDFLARAIFEKRFAIKPFWIKTGISFRNLESFQKIIPENSAILFANILGQVPLPRVSPLQKELKRVLQNHSWASYHDAMSGEKMQFDAELAQPFQKAPLSLMKKMIYPMVAKPTALTVNAHEAPDLFPADGKLNFRYWQWRLTPKRAHLIEGVFSNSATLTEQN
jgi:hypothetical protein